MPELLSVGDLPPGFEYPRLFLRVAEHGLLDLEPWHVLSGELLRLRARALASQYGRRTLVPFAYRQDNDDVACWESARTEFPVIVIDPSESPPLEIESFADFGHWFRRAIEDFIGWK